MTQCAFHVRFVEDFWHEVCIVGHIVMSRLPCRFRVWVVGSASHNDKDNN